MKAFDHAPRTIEETVRMIHESSAPMFDEVPGIVGMTDQLAAEAEQDLADFNIDLSDPETARIAAAITALAMNYARSAAGTDLPVSIVAQVLAFRGARRACVAINAAVLGKHKDRVR